MMSQKTRLACLRTLPASRLALALAAGAAAACVTLNVNVNFPESAVQAAADDYVRDLYRAKEGKAPSDGASPAPSPAAAPRAWLELLVAPAYADEAAPAASKDAEGTFKLDSPKAKALFKSMKGRVDDVIAAKQSGALGEALDGTLVIRAPAKIKPVLKARVEKLVKDENEDRRALYEEALASNGIQRSRLKDIQAKFHDSFARESPAGTWVESAAGNWSQKP
jgi:uncharacterized protein